MPTWCYFLTGAVGCNKQSLEYVLTKKGTGNAACLAIGGALEALDAHPGTFTLNLAKKKGFIKSALKTGYVCICCNITELSAKLSCSRLHLSMLGSCNCEFPNNF